jgi:ribosome-binding protein aMBF1 (putative translation factor)
MQSYQILLSTPRRAAGRFIATVRREIQKALAEEHASNGITQASIAAALNVNRSVIHRVFSGNTESRRQSS